MLGIKLASQGEPESICCQSLNTFLNNIREDNYMSEEVIQAHCNLAYKSLPTEFLKIHNIEINSDDRHIRIVEEYHKPSGR